MIHPQFDPSLHPRGPGGRFTRSLSRPATPAQRHRGEEIMHRFAPTAGTPLAGMPARKEITAAFLTDSRRINDTLRAGKANHPGIGALDRAMTPLPHDTLLTRSVPLSALGALKPERLTGLVVRDAGYFPTTAAPTPAAPGVMMLRIQAPAGTPAVADPDTGDVVLAHGLDMLVHGVRSDAAGVEMALTVLPGDGTAPDTAPAGVGPAPAAPAPAPPAPGPAPAPTPQPAPATVGSVGDLIDAGVPTIADRGEAHDRARQRLRAALTAAMNGTYAGLRVEVSGNPRRVGSGPDGEDPGVAISFTIYDADNNVVGSGDRGVYRDADGHLAAVHELLELEPGAQGGGFASAFNAHMLDWYRQQGISRVELTANIDVGGYSWASHGYDFADPASATAILSRLRTALDGTPDGPGAAAARALLARADSTPFGSPGYPTPYEISQLGRADGAPSWLGRTVMLGSSWEGVRWL